MPSLQHKRKAYKKYYQDRLKAAARAQYQAEPDKKKVALEAALAATYMYINLQVTYQMCFKAERGFKTNGATVREGINTDGERDCSQQSSQQLAAGVHMMEV